MLHFYQQYSWFMNNNNQQELFLICSLSTKTSSKYDMAVYILSVHGQNVSAKDATSILFLFIQSMYFRPDEIKDDLFLKNS